MKKTIDMMAQLLERNNIPVLDDARKKDGSSGSDNKEKCHALVAGSLDPPPSSLIRENQGIWPLSDISSHPCIQIVAQLFEWVMTLRSRLRELAGSTLTMDITTMSSMYHNWKQNCCQYTK